jgi:hypothetical protein
MSPYNPNTRPQATPAQVKSMSAKEVLADGPEREYILLAGKDTSGKTCSIIAMASAIESMVNPNATFHIVDIEQKFRAALRSFGTDVPDNIRYYPCETANDATDALDVIIKERKPGDWMALDSAGRLWEKAQDVGYKVIAGLDKASYMDKRREFIEKNKGVKQPPVTPKPDDLWSIIKGLHDGAFFDVIGMTLDLNVMITTPVSKVKTRSDRAENPDRVALRAECGIDMNLDGAPRLPYFAETLMVAEMKSGKVLVNVVRDNLCLDGNPRKSFIVANHKEFGVAFFTNCRM